MADQHTGNVFIVTLTFTQTVVSLWPTTVLQDEQIMGSETACKIY
jgi:hypothetical protein